MLTDVLRQAVGEARCRIFDWQHGIRTCGNANLTGLTITGNNTAHAVHYHPSHPKFLFEVFNSLNVDFQSSTFVDFGSGKGRVLLVASEFPFAEIIGVEFAAELHEIASRNIRNYRSKTQKCKNVRSINLDAAEFQLPPTPLVLYLFNPFGPGVLTPVLRNLQRSIEANPREVLMIYMAPFHDALVGRETSLKCVERGRFHNAYRFTPQS